MADENDDSISQIDPDELMRRVLGGDSSEMSPMRPSGGGSPAAPPPDPNPAPAMPSSGFDPSKLPPGLLASPMTPNTVPQPPTGSNNPNLVDLLKQQGANKPVDSSAVDPATGKPIYKMGTGQRVLGTVGNFLQGFSGKPFTPTYVGPGATNARYGRDVAKQEATAAHLGTQIQGQEKLDTENEKRYEDATKQAYEGQLGQARLDTAAAQQSKADTASQLADVKSLAVKNQFEEATKKLEEQAKRNEQLFQLGKGNQELRQQMSEMAIQLKQQQMENEKAKFATGTDAKSLEAERKQRLTAIENDWKQHPYLNKLFSDKGKEIQAVNDDINSRLSGAGVSTGAPSGSPQSQPAKVAPQTHSWSKSAWQKANPGGDVNAAAQMAKTQRFTVVP